MAHPRLTVISSHSCEMTKTFTLDDAGGLTSTAIAHMLAGDAVIRDVPDLDHLRTVLDQLSPRQAITLGVPLVGDTALTTRKGADFNPHAVARTNEAFRYLDGPAFFPIDVDTDTGVYNSVNDVLDALEATSPWLRHVARAARPSSSSYVGGRGLRGVHIYVPVTRGSDIAELGKRIQMDQWAAGRGRIVISRSGALLVRQLSDATVYQPSRLMFEAQPVLVQGVMREVPADQAWIHRAPEVLGRAAKYKTPEGWLDVQELPGVRDIDKRRFEVAVRQAKDRLRVEAKRVALDYHRANAMAAGREDGERLGVLALRALGDRRLPLSWPLRVADTEGVVTVQDVCNHLPTVLGRNCADPFDTFRPDLGKAHMGKAEIVMMHGKPGIWSHKLQEFFEFAEANTKEPHSPLELAAERLRGTIEEWPDKGDKKRNSLRNVMYAMELLAKAARIALCLDVCVEEVLPVDGPSISAWLAAVTHVGCSQVSDGTVERARDHIAAAHLVDPWKDIILALPQWDKVPRLDTMFTDVFGALPSEALTMTSRAFVAGVVMRQLKPGAPAPIVPILIGGQGPGKSLWVREFATTLGFPAPTELPFGDTRRMSMAAARSPVAELAEMAGHAKRDVEEVKHWVSDTQDVYRTPYGKKEVTHHRRFGLCGTANKGEIYHDETGERRLMPVHLLQAPSPNWAVDVAQIAAEAKSRFCDKYDHYIAMIRAASDAVREFNDSAMRSGQGLRVSDLDDILPPILRRNVQEVREQVRVYSGNIRTALDVQITGRRFSAQEIARWLKFRGWQVGTDGQGMRYYVAPPIFVDILKESDYIAPTNPFHEVQHV